MVRFLCGQLLAFFLLFPSVFSQLPWCPNADLNALGPATIHGNQFFDNTTGQYHPIIGINYYPRPNSGPLIANNIDFFTEAYRPLWERDLVRFQELGINTIRIFAVDGSQNHDAFACALRRLGIRLIIGLSASCLDCSLTIEAAPACYPAALKQRGQQIVAEFGRYDNVLAFSVSNEIGLQLLGTPEVNAPCAKQFIKDMRMFMAGCGAGMRQVPVGLAVADRDREPNALYYACEEEGDPDASMATAEWYGINAYQHCDATADPIRGFVNLRRDFEDFDLRVPVVLTEFGCINESFPEEDGFEAQRDFRQVSVLFSEEYSRYFAGGCVFEYSNEDRKTPSPWPYTEFFRQGNFGVGYFSPEDCDDIDVPCTYIPFPQYSSLVEAYDAVDVSYVPNLQQIDTSLSSVPGQTPECPVQFAPLQSFDWPSENVADFPCPIAPAIPAPPVPVPVPVRLTTASCAAHTACASLGGDCCPTPNGVVLSCCANQPQPMCQDNPLCIAILGPEDGECCPTATGLYLDCCAVLPSECENGAGACPPVYSTLQYQQDLAGTATATPVATTPFPTTLEPTTSSPSRSPTILQPVVETRETATPTTSTPTRGPSEEDVVRTRAPVASSSTPAPTTSVVAIETETTTPSPQEESSTVPPLTIIVPGVTVTLSDSARPTERPVLEPGSTFPPTVSSARQWALRRTSAITWVLLGSCYVLSCV